LLAILPCLDPALDHEGADRRIDPAKAQHLYDAARDE
jgi:hypothetical protein